MPDYAQKARALRAKAADPVVPEAERQALLEKAAELEAKYSKPNSPFTDQTTVTSRDGFGKSAYDLWVEAQNRIRYEQARKVAEDLLKNQWIWNSEYYDRNGKPHANEADTDNVEDYGYKWWMDGDYDTRQEGYDNE